MNNKRSNLLINKIKQLNLPRDEQGNLEFDCAKAVTTIDTNYFTAQRSRKYDNTMKLYLYASKLRTSEIKPELAAHIQTAQDNWKAYADKQCDTVYIYWQEGTIRTVMGLNCHIYLTQQRTHTMA